MDGEPLSLDLLITLPSPQVRWPYKNGRRISGIKNAQGQDKVHDKQ